MPGDGHSLAAVVFDCAGTVVDHGSRAPMAAFVELFKSQGVAISIAEARVPMGLPKWDLIQALGRLPRVADAWHRTRGQAFAADFDDRLQAVKCRLDTACQEETQRADPVTKDTHGPPTEPQAASARHQPPRLLHQERVGSDGARRHAGAGAGRRRRRRRR